MSETARLHDGAAIEIQIAGSGPTVLLPVNPVPAEGERADELRRWGMDPALGRTLLTGLADLATVVAFDYEGHVLANPKPDTLTPDNIVADIEAIADAAGATKFTYYGYSWLGLVGIQLAIRSPRLSAVCVAGFAPLDGPYREMLAVTEATHRLELKAASSPPPEPWKTAIADDGEIDWSTVPVTLTPDQTAQFVTLYRALEAFDDRAAQSQIACPRLCLVGGADRIDYDERWGGVRVDMAGLVERNRTELERLGWDVRVLDGLDHTGAMQPPAVLPVLRPWLARVLAAEPEQAPAR